jgi:hypothetical protein
MATMGYRSPSECREPEERRWQDVFMLVMSVWIIITPWFNGAGASPYSPMHAQLAGALLFLSTVWALTRQRDLLPEYVNLAVGCWLLARPFWGNIVEIQRAQLWVIGTLVVIFSLRSAYLARCRPEPAVPSALLTAPAQFGGPVLLDVEAITAPPRTVHDRNTNGNNGRYN